MFQDILLKFFEFETIKFERFSLGKKYITKLFKNPLLHVSYACGRKLPHVNSLSKFILNGLRFFIWTVLLVYTYLFNLCVRLLSC